MYFFGKFWAQNFELNLKFSRRRRKLRKIFLNRVSHTRAVRPVRRGFSADFLARFFGWFFLRVSLCPRPRNLSEEHFFFLRREISSKEKSKFDQTLINSEISFPRKNFCGQQKIFPGEQWSKNNAWPAFDRSLCIKIFAKFDENWRRKNHCVIKFPRKSKA